MAKLNDQFMAFDACAAARDLDEHAWVIPGLACQMRAACRPVGREDLTKRLTALGMMMAPNRPAAEATVWLHEMSRLLSDLPRDILFQAVDQCQRQNRFLPTVAEIREIADPLFTERKISADRLEKIRDAMNRNEPASPEPEGHKLCKPQEAEDILREYGLLDAVRRA